MFRSINPPPRQRLAPTPLRKARSARFKKVDIVRAVEAARASGLTIAEVQIDLDGGAIRILSADARRPADDDLYGRWEDRL